MEAMALRLEAIRLEAIAFRLEAIAIRFLIRLEAIAIGAAIVQRGPGSSSFRAATKGPAAAVQIPDGIRRTCEDFIEISGGHKPQQLQRNPGPGRRLGCRIHPRRCRASQ